jgi:hypothetical protein
MLAITCPVILKMIVFLYSINPILAEIGIEYLRINIEDTCDVPIGLFFSVAWQYLENAFNECKLLSKGRSARNNALVDDPILTHEEAKSRR